MIKNEVQLLFDENFNQKFLTNGGVCIYFGNVFLPVEGEKLPMIKNKLRQILVNFGLNKTYMEINQELNSIVVWYRDLKATELRGKLLQRYNSDKKSQALEVNINLEGAISSPRSFDGQVRTYDGLTGLIYQEFIQPVESVGIPESIAFYSKLQEIIQKGNLVACVPLSAILTEEVD